MNVDVRECFEPNLSLFASLGTELNVENKTSLLVGYTPAEVVKRNEPFYSLTQSYFSSIKIT